MISKKINRMKKLMITLSAVLFSVAALAQFSMNDAQVYLQFEGTEIIPSELTGVTAVDGTDSAYIKTTSTTVAQEPNKLVAEDDENVLWMDYDGHIKFDHTILNKDSFSVTFDYKRTGDNNVWWIGFVSVTGYDTARIVDDVKTPGYAHRHLQVKNPGGNLLDGWGLSTDQFSAKDVWAHYAITYDMGFVSLYINDSLIATNDSSSTFHLLENPSFYIGIKATINAETGEVTGGRNSNANADCKEFQTLLDDVALFDFALTAEQVNLVYNAAQGITSGISQVTNTELELYPNPVSDILYFGNKEISSVRIYSLSGSEVLDTKIYNAQINISELQSGMYFVKAYDQQNSIINTSKIIKK